MIMNKAFLILSAKSKTLLYCSRKRSECDHTTTNKTTFKRPRPSPRLQMGYNKVRIGIEAIDCPFKSKPNF